MKVSWVIDVILYVDLVTMIYWIANWYNEFRTRRVYREV